MNSIASILIGICILVVIHQSSGDKVEKATQTEQNASVEVPSGNEVEDNVKPKSHRATVTPWGTLGDGNDGEFSNFFRKFINRKFHNSLKHAYYADFLDDEDSSSGGSNCNMWGCSAGGNKCGMYGCSSRLD